MKILFLVPMRSGSKGVVNKNIKEFCGKPLFLHAIDAIKSSAIYNDNCKIVISTDSEQYANIAIKNGLDVPNLRPHHLSTDNAKVSDTMKYIMEEEDKLGNHYDYFAMIQVTSPLTQAQDFDKAMDLFADESVPSILSVSETECPELWMSYVDDNGRMSGFSTKLKVKENRQQLKTSYKLTGAIRISRWHELIKNGYDFLMPNAAPLVIPRERAVDIDTELDFKYAEFLYKEIKNA